MKWYLSFLLSFPLQAQHSGFSLLESIQKNHPFENPASIRYATKKQIYLAHQSPYQLKELQQNRIAISYPTTLANAALLYEQKGEILQEQHYALGLARDFNNWAVGLRFTYSYQQIEQSRWNASSPTISWGLLIPTLPKLSTGIYLQHLNRQNQYTCGIRYQLSRQCYTAAQWDSFSKTSYEIHYQYHPKAAIKLGWRQGEEMLSIATSLTILSYTAQLFATHHALLGYRFQYQLSFQL